MIKSILSHFITSVVFFYSLSFLIIPILNCQHYHPYDGIADENINKHTCVHSRLEDTKGNFTLYISNQSSDIKKVDIKVKIDSVLVVDDIFRVEYGHNWYMYKFSILKGSHTIEANTEKGGASISRRFEIDTTLQACLDYWYRNKSDDTLYNKRFSLKFANIFMFL